MLNEYNFTIQDHGNITRITMNEFSLDLPQFDPNETVIIIDSNREGFYSYEYNGHIYKIHARITESGLVLQLGGYITQMFWKFFLPMRLFLLHKEINDNNPNPMPKLIQLDDHNAPIEKCFHELIGSTQ
jgi:hypothetical protein